jgi:hypothetical protein
MKVEDFDSGTLTAQDGQKLRFLWAKHLFQEAQRAAWVFWFKIGSTLVVALGAALAIWTTIHGSK